MFFDECKVENFYYSVQLVNAANLESQYLQLNAFNWEITFPKRRTEENISDSIAHYLVFPSALTWNLIDLKLSTFKALLLAQAPWKYKPITKPVQSFY